MTEQSERSRSTLQDLVIRGTKYREDYEFELYGEETTAIIRPLADEHFLPIAAGLADIMDMDVEDQEERDEAVSEAIDEVDESEEGDIDISKLDEDFVELLQSAAILGLTGGYDEDGNEIEYDEEEKRDIIEGMMGAYSVEIGGRVLELSGDVRDAEKFRGGRGRVERTGDS